MRLLMGMSDRKRSYQWLRPENNLKVSKKYMDMTYQDLMFGMGRVIDHLRAGKSPLPFPTITLEGYMKHFRFVSLKGLATNFKPGVLNEYEHEVTSKVMEGSIPDFVGGEHDCVVENLGADSTKAATPPPQNQQSSKAKRKRSGQGHPDCPPDICAKWNYTWCDYGLNCNKNHICVNCRVPSHKGKMCNRDVRMGPAQPQNQHQQQQQQGQQATQYQQGGQSYKQA